LLPSKRGPPASSGKALKGVGITDSDSGGGGSSPTHVLVAGPSQAFATTTHLHTRAETATQPHTLQRYPRRLSPTSRQASTSRGTEHDTTLTVTDWPTGTSSAILPEASVVMAGCCPDAKVRRHEMAKAQASRRDDAITPTATEQPFRLWQQLKNLGGQRELVEPKHLTNRPTVPKLEP
jgi:hypothetical protein